MHSSCYCGRIGPGLINSSKVVLSSAHQGSKHFPTQGLCFFQRHCLSYVTTFSFSTGPSPSAHNHAGISHKLRTVLWTPHSLLDTPLFLCSRLYENHSGVICYYLCFLTFFPLTLFELSYLALRLSSCSFHSSYIDLFSVP